MVGKSYKTSMQSNYDRWKTTLPDKPLLDDWQEQPLYQGEEGYETVHGIVRDDDQEILKYFKDMHDKIWIGR